MVQSRIINNHVKKSDPMCLGIISLIQIKFILLNFYYKYDEVKEGERKERSPSLKASKHFKSSSVVK